MSNNFYKDNDDLQYYLESGMDWDPLVRLTEFDYRADGAHANVEEATEFYREVLELFGTYVANELEPHVASIDHKKAKLGDDGEVVEPAEWVRAFNGIYELGMTGLPIPREFGGMNAPVLIYLMNAELIARSDVSAMTHYSFHAGIALALLVYSAHEGSLEIDADNYEILDTPFRQAVEEIASGEAWGCMDITEPNAGSDMAALTAKAEKDADGNWFITGGKIFITSGHGKWHVVIARSEGEESPGLEGLSLFLVKAYDDNEDGTRERYVDIVRVEEKLGHNGSATCALEFDRTPARLIGARGEGFKLMLLLMNNARVGVGFECIGAMERARRLAVDYAAERRSMGKTIDRHEMIFQYLERMDLETRALRAMVMHAGYNEELAHKLNMYGGALIDNGHKLETLGIHNRDELEAAVSRHQWKARRLTPLLKYYGGEKSVEHAQMGIQIHGGAGYTKEYGAEKVLRDAMVLPIYEGTSQIQSLMAMKDNIGQVLKNPQQFLTDMAQARWRSLSSSDAMERRVSKLQWTAKQAIFTLLQRTAADKFRDIRKLPVREWKEAFVNMDPKRDFAFAMLHAERLIQILINASVAEIFYEQSQNDAAREELLVRWLELVEPHTRFLMDEIQNNGDRLLDKLAQVNAADAAAE